MDTRLILTEKAYEKDALSARLFLSIFGLDWRQEVRAVDVSKDEVYENRKSSTKASVKSLRTDWVISLAPETCVALVCDKRKSLQIGLNGQQGTLNGRYAVEVYADNRKPKYGLTATAETIIHEVMHALSEYHNVADTLHTDLKTKTLEQAREILLDRILDMKNVWGVLPEVSGKIFDVMHYAAGLGTPIKILEGYRSPERQDELYKKKPKVTNAKAWQSMHQYRVAFDYCFEGTVPFPPSGDQKWNRINNYARSIGLYSYGIEENFDDGHLQLTFGKTERQIMSRDIDWIPYWNAPASLKFARDLTIGSVGEDVIELQRYLNHRGFTVSREGHGSPGSETDYFGKKTQGALIRFQKAHGIAPASGFLGPITRKYIG